MKFIGTVLLFFCSFLSEGQLKKVEWATARIDLYDTTFTGEVALDNSFFEGTLLVKDGERIVSLSPQNVKMFSVFSPKSQPLTFKSVPTSFIKNVGAKPSFLMEAYLGETFSLYSKFLPDKKRSGFILPVGGGWFAAGVFTIIKNEEVLFISYNGQAYQVSIPKELEEGIFKVDKKRFYRLMGNRSESVKQFLKENKKKLFFKDDLVEILKFANSI